MGIYDSMAQKPAPPAMGQQPNAMGQGFAQQKPVGNMQKPNNNMARMGQSVGNVASKFMQNKPGAGGSNSMLQQKQLMQKNQQAAATGGAIGGSYNQLLSANPQLQQFRQTGAGAGQNMSWMDKPGALSMAPPAPIQNQRPQYGLQDVASRYAQEQQPVNPVQQAQEQMRGYEGPDLGSQDPRELARMGMGQGQLQPLQGSVGLQAPPFEGNQPGSNSFQAMAEQYGGQRPDVMPRGGIGPSFMEQATPMQMDENGMEPRRGAR